MSDFFVLISNLKSNNLDKFSLFVDSGNINCWTFLISEGPNILKKYLIAPVDFPSSYALTIEVILSFLFFINAGRIVDAPYRR